jgi:threonine/homoserine/homoserine lactone efflux protein
MFFKALVIGFCIAAPVGPIGMLCIQRSLSRGFRSGFVTGLGAACADTLYGLLGALGAAGVVSALPKFSVVLKIVGGAFLVWLAWKVSKGGAEASEAQGGGSDEPSVREFWTTFALTLSNPLTILSFVAIFAVLGTPLPSTSELTAKVEWLALVPLVAGVFVGSAAWWFCLSGITSSLRVNVPASLVHTISRVSALVIAVFGVVQLAAGLYSLARAG